MANKKTTSEPTTAKKTATKSKLPPRVDQTPDRVVVLQTNSKGKELVIRSNPTTEQVESFVASQHQRYAAGQNSGDDTSDPVPSFAILHAVEYESEKARVNPQIEGRPIRIKGTLPKKNWPDWAKKD